MKLIQPTILRSTTFLLVAALTSFSFQLTAEADRYSYDVNYDQVIQHSHDLENIAIEMKECFRDQFRYSQLYGKLNSRSSKIKNYSHRLHRLGVSHGRCSWHEEIHRLDALVAELGAFVDQAVYRSRRGYDRPICRDTTRTVRRLLIKADYHVNALTEAIHRLEGQNLVQPFVPNRIINEPAPNFAPPRRVGSGVGAGAYRTGGRYENEVSTRFVPRGNTCSQNVANQTYDRGVALNIGRFKFYLNN